jgi:hypothetical protein
VWQTQFRRAAWLVDLEYDRLTVAGQRRTLTGFAIKSSHPGVAIGGNFDDTGSRNRQLLEQTAGLLIKTMEIC